jgi:hypothetical protein
MSNDVSSNPLIIDTAATTTVISNKFHVTAIKWTVDNGGADNDTVVLQDQHGKVKYEEILNIVTSGPVQAPPINFNPALLFDGLICPTLSGGKVYIYFDSTKGVPVA